MSLKLQENDIWCVDGTFDTIPSPYKQLYSLSVIKNHHVFPCIYVILKNKTEVTYLKMYEFILRMIGNLNPRAIKTDFEKASINALHHFSDAHVSGRQLHLSQAIQRKIQELGRSSMYRTNYNVKKFTRSVKARSYERFTELNNTFFNLRNHPGFTLF